MGTVTHVALADTARLGSAINRRLKHLELFLKLFSGGGGNVFFFLHHHRFTVRDPLPSEKLSPRIRELIRTRTDQEKRCPQNNIWNSPDKLPNITEQFVFVQLQPLCMCVHLYYVYSHTLKDLSVSARWTLKHYIKISIILLNLKRKLYIKHCTYTLVLIHCVGWGDFTTELLPGRL